jgi:hypothetical protein
MGKRGGKSGKRDWREVDERLIKRGEFYLSMEFLEKWDEALERMNREKRGRPFRFPEAFIEWTALIHVLFYMPYRQMEGFLRALSQFVDLDPAHYTTLFKRIKLLDMDFDLLRSIDVGDDLVIALDSTGIKVSNRGEWMRQKWRVRRGWIKVHVSADVETKQILGVEITSEEVGDSRMFESLVTQSMRAGNVVKALADGAYDKRDNFNFSKSNGITAGIKTRENASTRARGSPYRASMVRERKALGYEAWRDKYDYGQRWSAEGVYSTFKRIFGETLRATSIPGMFRELRLKIMAYNILINIC